MAAPRGNKNAMKAEDELTGLIKAYIAHRASGFSKKSFPECDYETIEKHLESNVVFRPLKEQLERAEREGLKVWEEIGIKISKGELKGNAATWIFTMKNKYPEDWQDNSGIDTNVTGELTIVRKVIHAKEEKR